MIYGQARTGGHGRVDIGLLAQRENDASHQARDTRDLRDGNGGHHIPDTAARQCHQRNGQQDRGDGHDPIHDAHGETVRPAHEAGEKSNGETRHRGHDGDREPDQQRDARAIEHTRVDVAAEHIRSEPELCGGIGKAPRRSERGGVHGAHKGGDDGDQKHEAEQGPAKGNRRVAITKAGDATSHLDRRQDIEHRRRHRYLRRVGGDCAHRRSPDRSPDRCLVAQ